jgi:hypothetical protein
MSRTNRLVSARIARAPLVFGASALLALTASCGGASTASEATTAAAQGPELRFTLRPSAEDLTKVDVEACYRGIPFSTTPPLPSVRDVVGPDGSAQLLVSPEGSVDLRPLASGDCIRYRAELPADQQLDFGSGELGYWIGPPNRLLVIPHTAPRDTPLSVRLELPADVTSIASSSLRPTGDALRTDVATVRGAALIGWGKGFGRGEATAGGGSLDWTLLPGSEWSVEAISGWLGDAARGASAVLGRFPYESLALVVVAVDEPPAPVVFDYLVPGSGGVAVVRVDRSLSAGALREHPAALLEMLRLGLPVMTDDLWAMEGVLAYYREIVGVRLGYQRANDAFRHLHQMLGDLQDRRYRPRESSAGALLPDVPRADRGVALALLADVALRRAGSSLDARIGVAFGDASRRNAIHSLDDVVAALDAGLERPVVAPLARAVARGTIGDELGDAYRQLAMTAKRGGNVSLGGGRSAGARLRAAITAAAPPTEAVAEADAP